MEKIKRKIIICGVPQVNDIIFEEGDDGKLSWDVEHRRHADEYTIEEYAVRLLDRNISFCVMVERIELKNGQI